MGLNKETKIKLYAKFKKGNRNLITDVAGVRVGQVTIKSEDHNVNTGVTAIIPHEGNLFKEKVFAANSVINGFGKSVGLVQMDELGTLESPIVLTNTLSVGTALTASVKYSLRENTEIGVETGTVNCVVGECNDGRLNDIRGLHVQEDDVLCAIDNASYDFEEGAVGAGAGMVMMGLKGGIGSASRIIELDRKEYTIGALCLTNYGADGCLMIGGNPVGRKIEEQKCNEDKGSCIIVLATDIPMTDRQLKRLANRGAHALARTGSYSGNGSGDIAIAFSTANKIEHFNQSVFKAIDMIYDDELSIVFEAGIEAMEEALISSLDHAVHTVGFKGREKNALNEFIF